MSIIKLILFSLLANILIAEDPPNVYDELKCGKEDSPKKEKDCTKYGTGSGMVCCWISDESKSNGKCRLVPNDLARDSGIRGTFTFNTQSGKQYWDCGNNANYLYSNFLMILLILILL